MISIPDNNGRFLHNCNTIPGASGGPIILVDDFSVIGIHKGYDIENKKNVGVLLRNIILDIQNKQPLNLKKDKPLVNIDNKENNNIIIDDKDIDKNDDQNNYDDIDNYNMNNIINRLVDMTIIKKIVKDNNTVNVVFVGEYEAKKSKVLNQFAQTQFDFGNPIIRTIQIPDFNVELILELWDTVGQKAYRELSKIFFKEADVIILVYDIRKESTFREIQNFWYTRIKNFALKNPILGLIANNIDKIYNSKISINEGRTYAKQIGAFFRTSSFETDINLEKLFVDIGKTYLIKKQEEYKKNQKECILI